MKYVFTLGVLVLLIACAQAPVVLQNVSIAEPINNSESVIAGEYTVFPCTLSNGNWTFRMEYPDVTLDRTFRAEDVCRDELQAYTTTSRGELERCYAVNGSDCLTLTAVKVRDETMCRLYSETDKIEECKTKVKEAK